MRSPSVLGTMVGVFAVTVSVAGTLRRGDPHFVSAAPDLLTLAVIWAAMFVAMKAVAGPSLPLARGAATQVTALAAAVHGIGLAAFTVGYLPTHPLSLGLVAGLSTAAVMALIGWSAARVALGPRTAPATPVAWTPIAEPRVAAAQRVRW